MFSIGDKIVYPLHGAGEIVAIEQKEVLGTLSKYYILKIPVNEMRVMIPVNNADDVGIRYIMSIDEMDKVLETLKHDRTKMPLNWNRRYRENMDKIKTGDVMEIADVVRNLELLDNEKTLSTGEKKMLNNARQIIESEMMLVYSVTYDEAVEIVNDAISYGDGDDDL